MTPGLHNSFRMGLEMRMGIRRYCSVLASIAWLAMAPLPACGQPADSGAMVIRISVAVRQLWVINAAGDTLLTVSVSVGSGRTLTSDSRSWTFDTPTGETRVAVKQENPVWIPPDWHYVELAQQRELRLARLPLDTPVTLSGGRVLLVRNFRIGLLGTDSTFRLLEPGEEVVFDSTLFIPPFGTEQRRVAGILGKHRLVLANGMGLHGTPEAESIGRAVTHGCIRLRDDAIAWLYENVPIGTRVLIY